MRGRKTKQSKKPGGLRTTSQIHKDVGSGSDNESIGDIFTDEINEFTEARNKVNLGPAQSDSEEEEAILPLHGDDDDNDSDEELGEWSRRLKQIKFQNKLDGNRLKKDKPEGSWGNKRQDYYGSFTWKNERRIAANENDQWTLEAREVDKLQSKLDEDVDEDDFIIPSLALPSKPSAKKVTELTVRRDLSEKERREHLDKLHPEVQPLKEELNKCLEELENLQEQGGWRVKSKDTCFRLLAANIAFYLHLVESAEDCRGHPVLKRIVQWKKLAKLYQEIPDHLMEASEGESDVDQEGAEMKWARQEEEEEEEEDMAVAYDEEQKDVDSVVGRPITFQIEKNRATTKRSQRNNPRVKHRKKFKKAIIRRGGQSRQYKPEVNKYRGETSGIRAGVKKSIRLH